MDTSKKKKYALLVGSSDFYLDERIGLDDAYIIALDGGYASLMAR